MDFLVGKSQLHTLPLLPDILSHNSEAGSMLVGAGRNSPGNWAAAKVPQTVDTNCRRHLASDEWAHGDSACPRACAFASPVPESVTSSRGFAFPGFLTRAPKSLFFHASSVDTW